MIRRSPAEYYIKYLLLHPDKYDDEDVKRVLREHQLDFPGGRYLEVLRARLRPPRPFFPLNDQHASSFRFLVGEKVHTLFHRDKKTLAALEILNRPRTKEAVEAMTLAQEPAGLIVVRLQRMGLGSYQLGDLQRYSHFFWNLELVDNMELHALIQKRVGDLFADGDDPKNLVVAKAMQKAQYNDPRFLAAGSPVPIVAAMRLQVRYGYMPDKVTTTRLADLAAAVGQSAAIEVASAKTPLSAKQYRDFMTGAAQAAILRQTLGSPEESVQREIQQLAISTGGDRVPHIDELTGGDFTEGVTITVEGENVDR